jgi:hypothetical protein
MFLFTGSTLDESVMAKGCYVYLTFNLEIAIISGEEVTLVLLDCVAVED